MNSFATAQNEEAGLGRGRLRFVSRQGSALVISLVFIILITIAIVGFVTTAALERKTVQSHYASVQADLYSSMAVGVVASRITAATSQTNAWWVSQPGRIAYTPYANNSTVPTTTFVELSSGHADSAINDVSINLNPASLTQATGLFAGDASKAMPVKWIYIRKDGTQEVAASQAPSFDKENPVLGRYAYWADDETSRINLNTAGSRVDPENQATAHPSRVDLTVLTPLTPTDIQKIRALRESRVLNSVEEFKGVPTAPNVAEALGAHKEALTHFSHSPDLNRFGEPKIVLTTQANKAGGRPFLDILQAGKENTDPGVDASLDNAKIQALFSRLYPYFGKRACDWGLVNPAVGNYWNKTLIDRYGGAGLPYPGPRFAAGIILNIIDYVRAVESAETLVLPLRAAFNPLTGTLTLGVANYSASGNFGANGIRGNSRRVHIVEMGLWLPSVTTIVSGVPVYQGKLKVRVFLPENAGSNVDIVALGLSLQPTLKSSAGGNYPVSEFAITNAHLVEGNGVMQPGQYRTIVHNVNISAGSPAVRPAQVRMRLALKNGLNGTGYDFGPLEQSETLNKYALYVVDPPATTEALITSISTDDPAVNQSASDWLPKSGSQQANRFGTQNVTPESTLGQPVPSSVPQQDGDSDGKLTGVGTLLPAPKGSAGNPRGTIDSVGDLGRIHSGMAGTSVPGKAWRTLRLQPRFAPNGSLPDWLLLDLFSMPLPADGPADGATLQPDAGTVGGRINLNAKALPFTNPPLIRDQPLRAVIQAVEPAAPIADVEETVAEILGFDGTPSTLASGPLTTGTAFGTAALISQGVYVFPGTICEVKGIADDGESGEAFVRGLVGFFTTQSNVFSVYAVGQRIQQLPSGAIKILGESRTRSLLERYQDGTHSKVRVLSTNELGI